MLVKLTRFFINFTSFHNINSCLIIVNEIFIILLSTIKINDVSLFTYLYVNHCTVDYKNKHFLDFILPKMDSTRHVVFLAIVLLLMCGLSFAQTAKNISCYACSDFVCFYYNQLQLGDTKFYKFRNQATEYHRAMAFQIQVILKFYAHMDFVITVNTISILMILFYQFQVKFSNWQQELSSNFIN